MRWEREEEEEEKEWEYVEKDGLVGGGVARNHNSGRDRDHFSRVNFLKKIP